MTTKNKILKKSKLWVMRLSKRILFLLLLVNAVTFSLFAQNLNIRGRVVTATNEPVIGATVIVNNTSRGTATDVDGNFALENVPSNATLTVSYIGYLTRQITVVDNRFLEIVLDEESETLDEVVVVGYGVQKKVNLTGAVSSIEIGKLAETRPISNLSAGLAGLAPGLYVRSQNNDPGSNATLMIRGQGTLNNSSPLVIIDGVEGDISRIAPQDVANISVLKDAASSAIYGSRAANGVILITTKQGQKGKISVNYDGYYASQSVGKLIPLVSNSVRYMELINEAAANSKLAPVYTEENIQLWRDNEGGDPLLWPNTDWGKALFRTTGVMNHSVSASGGSDRLNSFISFNYAGTPGIIENTGYKRYGIRSNNQLSVTSWLNVGMNLSGTLTEKERGSDNLSGMFTNSILSVPTVVVRSPDGRYGGTNNAEDNTVARSPLVYMKALKGGDKAQTFNGRFYFNFHPIEGLNVDGSYNYNFFTKKQITIPVQIDTWNFQTNSILSPGAGTQLYVQNREDRSFRNFMDLTTSFEKRILENFYFKVLAGASQEQYISEVFLAQKQDLIDPSLTQINAASGDMSASGSMTDWAMRSLFARVNLSWADRYLAEFNVRRDGSSRFVGDNRWGSFPSASAAWRISEEPFMSNLRDNWLDNLKLRVSYGSLGNNATDNYAAIPVMGATKYVFNNVPTLAYYQAAIKNANLTWETTTVSNIGLDFGFLNNRLSGSLDFYNKFTHNILINLPAPAVLGNAGVPDQNSAEVLNRGVELNLGWRDKIEEFSYFADLNLTYNKNKVVKFKGEEYSLSGINMIKEGLPINTGFMLLVDRIVESQEDLDLIQTMVNNAKDEQGTPINPFPYGKPELGDFLYQDTNNDGLINDNDRVNVGSGSNPKFFYSFSLGASYKGIDASVFMDGVGGIKGYFQNDYYSPILRWTRIINSEVADGRWYEGRKDPARYPRFLYDGNTRNTRSSDFWYYNMSFFKIRNIQLGYTLPKSIVSKADISRLRFYIGLENYFTFTQWKGLDPEVSGMDYPSMRQAVFGVNLTF